MEKFRRWQQRKTASWFGMSYDFEQSDARIRALKQKAEELDADPAAVVDLVRPRLVLWGEYLPSTYLLPRRIEDALRANLLLPPPLHALMVHGESSRQVLLDAVGAYAEKMAPGFVFESRDEQSPAESVVNHFVKETMKHARRQFRAYVAQHVPP